ncbi:MAG TPA: hypothetical protein P5133_12170 [Spirochaetia bacterium]|nr:hypothetical protein [Spirochaetia bacterium]
MSRRSPARRAAREAALPFLEAARSEPAAPARLLNSADRDLAVVLWALEEEEVAELLALVGPAKAARLAEELERMEHVRLPPETVGIVAAHLALHLAGGKPLGPATRYYKPAR